MSGKWVLGFLSYDWTNKQTDTQSDEQTDITTYIDVEDFVDFLAKKRFSVFLFSEVTFVIKKT